MTSPGSLTVNTFAQVADYLPGSTFGPREVVDCEFVWVLRGSALWTVSPNASKSSIIPEQQHLLRPGMLALCRLGTIDSFHWDPNQPTSHAYVHFRVAGGLAAYSAEWPPVRSFSDAPVLDALCGYLIDLGRIGDESARTRSDELLWLLFRLFVEGPFLVPDPLPTCISAMAEQVRLRWGSSGIQILDIDELAAGAGVSPGHLFRSFRERFGTGPARALELIRLAHSAIALRRSNASLDEIARQFGFANPYHFSRRFGSAYGMPPGRFRIAGGSIDALQPIKDSGLLPLASQLLSGLP